MQMKIKDLESQLEKQKEFYEDALEKRFNQMEEYEEKAEANAREAKEYRDQFEQASRDIDKVMEEKN